MTNKEDNVLLRFSGEEREWVRLTEATPLNPSDRLVCLAPFHATLDLASAGLTMLGGSELRLTVSTPTGQARFEPRTGRFKAVKNARGDAVALDLGGREFLTLGLKAASPVGIERLNRREPGRPADPAATWAISCREGTLSIIQGAEKKSFDAPVVITVNSAGVLEKRPGESPPISIFSTAGPSTSPYWSRICSRARRADSAPCDIDSRIAAMASRRIAEESFRSSRGRT